MYTKSFLSPEVISQRCLQAPVIQRCINFLIAGFSCMVLFLRYVVDV